MTAALLAARDATERVLASKQGPFAVLAVLGLIAIVFPPAALGVAFIIWQRRDELSTSAGDLLSAQRTWYLWIPAIVIVAFTWFKGGTIVPDDMARHVTSYLHHYDYSDFYVYSDPRTPHSSMWIGFEVVTGYVHRALGLFWTTQALQALGFFWAIALFTKLFLDALKEHPERMLLTAIGIAFVLYSVLLSRVQAARPEVFLALLSLTGLLCNTRGKAVVWLLAMLLVQPFYWLAAIYAPTAFLLANRSWRARFAMAVLIGATGVTFWLWYAGADWYGFFPLLKEWMGNRAFHVGENNSIYHLLFLPGSLFLILIAILLSKQEDWQRNAPLLLVLAWFLAPNQVRYASIISPLVGVIAMRAVGRTPFNLRPVTRFMGVLVILSLMIGRMYGPGYSNLPDFQTIKGNERILTMFEASTFWLPAQFPGVKVAPSLEVGATEMGVQNIIKHVIKTQTLDCKEIAQYPEFTHIVDRNIESIPPCLELQELHRDWRLWRIKPVEIAQ